MDKKKQKQMQIKDSRNALVVQSNSLIRDVRTLRYGLSTQQQRILVYLISKVCKDYDGICVQFSYKYHDNQINHSLMDNGLKH